MKFIAKSSKRLDIFLTQTLEKPRNQISNLIKKEFVKVNSNIVKKAGFKLETNDEVEVNLPQLEQKQNYEVNFDIEIIYEDDEILVLNKPPFLTVHQAKTVKEATLVDWLKSKNFCLSNLAGEERYGIVHRIDKETSGALVVAKTNEAHLHLSKQLEQKTMGRVYLALVDLALKEDCMIEKPIARNPKNRLKMGIVDNGKNAKTAFVKLLQAKNSKTELIAAKLFTGRTHQIRVHLESINRHILGDFLYGFKSQKAKIPRVMLHAYGLYLKHPKDETNLQFIAPFFDDFTNLINKFFSKEMIDEKTNISNIVGLFNSLDSRLWEKT